MSKYTKEDIIKLVKDGEEGKDGKTKGIQSGCLTGKKPGDMIPAYKAREPWFMAGLACFHFSHG